MLITLFTFFILGLDNSKTISKNLSKKMATSSNMHRSSSVNVLDQVINSNCYTYFIQLH